MLIHVKNKKNNNKLKHLINKEETMLLKFYFIYIKNDPHNPRNNLTNTPTQSTLTRNPYDLPDSAAAYLQNIQNKTFQERASFLYFPLDR